MSKKGSAELERKRMEKEANERFEVRRRKRNDLARLRRQREKSRHEFRARQAAEARGEIYVSKETRGRKRNDPTKTTPEAVSPSRGKCPRTSLNTEPELKRTLDMEKEEMQPSSKFAARDPKVGLELLVSEKPDVSNKNCGTLQLKEDKTNKSS